MNPEPRTQKPMSCSSSPLFGQEHSKRKPCFGAYHRPSKAWALGFGGCRSRGLGVYFLVVGGLGCRVCGAVLSSRAPRLLPTSAPPTPTSKSETQSPQLFTPAREPPTLCSEPIYCRCSLHYSTEKSESLVLSRSLCRHFHSFGGC